MESKTKIMIKLTLQVPTHKNIVSLQNLEKTQIYEQEGSKKRKSGWWCICMHVFDLTFGG